METNFLLPTFDDDSAGFWEGCHQGELRVQQCVSCGHRQFPPRQMCPRCQSFDLAWHIVSGFGTLWSFAVPHPPLLPAYGELAPYPVGVIELAEDSRLRMVGNLVTEAGAPINSIDPQDLEIGQPLEVVFTAITDDVTLPYWRPR